MKTTITIAALFTAAAFLTPANATPVLFTAPLSAAGSYTITDGAATLATITATGFGNVFYQSAVEPQVAAPAVGAANGNPNGSTSADAETPETLDYKNATTGLGLKGNLSPYIGPGEAIVVDFSDVARTAAINGGTATLSGITFNLQVDINGPSNWTVYTLNSAGTEYIDPLSGPMAKGSAPVGTFGESPTTFALPASGDFNGSYLIGITNDCGLTITGITLDYTPNGPPIQSTPEPGTFVMAGMAFIGLGIVMKKRSRKA